jgi:hypothetical protein
MKFAPKLASETAITVRNNGKRETFVANNFVEKNSGCFRCCEGVVSVARVFAGDGSSE